MNKPSKDQDERSEKETAKRRDDILRRMHKMPPKPQSEVAGKRKPKGKFKTEKDKPKNG